MAVDTVGSSECNGGEHDGAVCVHLLIFASTRHECADREEYITRACRAFASAAGDMRRYLCTIVVCVTGPHHLNDTVP